MMAFEMTKSIPIIDKERYQRIINKALEGNRKISIEKLSFEDWLSIRVMLGIGGSEVATILNMNQYETPFSIWKKKVSDEIEIEENDYMTFGILVEPAIIAWYNKRTKSNAVKDTFIRIHPEYDCLFTNLDGVIHDEHGNEIGLVECKSTSYRNYELWENDTEDCVQGIPLYHYCQVQHELSITGLPWCDLAILITDRRQLKIKRILRDDEYIKKQNTALVMWWNAHVVPMVPPEMTAKEISYLEPMLGSFIEADEETYENIRLLKKAQENYKSAEELVEKIKSEIIKKINDKETLVYCGEVVATYKMQSRAGLQTDLLKKEEPDIYERYKKVSSFRVLRPKIKE
jgi:putative phage-type endonuclease